MQLDAALNARIANARAKAREFGSELLPKSLQNDGLKSLQRAPEAIVLHV